MLHGMLLIQQNLELFNIFVLWPVPTVYLYFDLGILLALSESCSKLQFSIAHLCETWWDLVKLYFKKIL